MLGTSDFAFERFFSSEDFLNDEGACQLNSGNRKLIVLSRDALTSPRGKFWSNITALLEKSADEQCFT